MVNAAPARTAKFAVLAGVVGGTVGQGVEKLVSTPADCNSVGGLGNRIHLKSDRSLRQQSAVHRCSSVHGDHRFCQYDALEVRGGSNGHRASDRPEDVLGPGAAGQGHPHSASLVQRSRHLEDPDIVRAARERDVR